jgi:(2R)-sulfolactate sulfo-lyase subunit alpha
MIHFVVHDEGDSVGVVVVEGIKASQELTGWIMDQDRELSDQSRRARPRPQHQDQALVRA